jgi:cold shock CspA family protein
MCSVSNREDHEKRVTISRTLEKTYKRRYKQVQQIGIKSNNTRYHPLTHISIMYTSALLLGTVAILLDTASAHGFVKGVNVKGTFTNGSDPVWYYYSKDTRPQTAGWDSLNQDIGFVEPASAGTADVNCHKSATAGRLYANVNAGDTIEFEWNTWPDSHKGPIINYIAPCNGMSATCMD